MKLYGVLNITGDLPNSGSSWLEALERQLGRELPEYYRGEKMSEDIWVATMVALVCKKTEYIAYIPKSFNETKITISVSM